MQQRRQVHSSQFVPKTYSPLNHLYSNSPPRRHHHQRFEIPTDRYIYIQWNPSNPDTNGTELQSQMSLFQGLNCMQELFFGERKCVLFRRIMSSFHTGVLR